MIKSRFTTVKTPTRNLRTVSEKLLESTKRAVEIAIEQDEDAGLAFLDSEGALT